VCPACESSRSRAGAGGQSVRGGGRAGRMETLGMLWRDACGRPMKGTELCGCWRGCVGFVAGCCCMCVSQRDCVGEGACDGRPGTSETVSFSCWCQWRRCWRSSSAYSRAPAHAFTIPARQHPAHEDLRTRPWLHILARGHSSSLPHSCWTFCGRCGRGCSICSVCCRGRRQCQA